MGILEKLRVGFESVVAGNLDRALTLTDKRIKDLKQEIETTKSLAEQETKEPEAVQGLGANQIKLQNLERRLRGEQDKLALLQEKKRREEEKAGQR